MKLTLKIVKAARKRTGQAAANVKSKVMAVTDRKNPKVTMLTWDDSEASESDDDILYSLADRPNPDMGHDTEEDRCAVSDSFISKSLLEKWSSCAPTVHQARAQNVVKGKPGLTSFPKQCVSDKNSVFDCFVVFFSLQMWDHIVECTNKEGQRVKQELWTMTSRKELKAFVGP